MTKTATVVETTETPEVTGTSLYGDLRDTSRYGCDVAEEAYPLKNSGNSDSPYDTEEEAISVGIRRLKVASGCVKYVLIMKDNGSFRVHNRFSQPCWGELRKYKSIHKEECTQPINYRPGDLYWPFPSGEPVAIVAGMFADGSNTIVERCQSSLLHHLLYGNVGWFQGLNPNDIFMTRVGCGSRGCVDQAFLVMRGASLDLESTRLINFLPNKSILKDWERFDRFLQSGVCPNIAALQCFSRGEKHGKNTGYYHPSKVDPFRFLEARPINWAGGSFRNRFDYSRSEFENPFYLFVKGRIKGYETRTFQSGSDSCAKHIPQVIENHEREMERLGPCEFKQPDISESAGYDVSHGKEMPNKDLWLPQV